MSVYNLRRRFLNKHKEHSSRISAPSHRHASPSAPWPWINIDDEVDPVQLASPLHPIPPPCSHETCASCWRGYPQSLYPNWTPSQVLKSKITRALTDYHHDISCIVHQVDIDVNGLFRVPDSGKIVSNDASLDETWRELANSDAPENNRVRCLFVENMSGPMLQMLGTRYNIEPFFFSSSLNWIPSRYQESVAPGHGDHITITLMFPRSVGDNHPASPDAVSSTTLPTDDNGKQNLSNPSNDRYTFSSNSTIKFAISLTDLETTLTLIVSDGRVLSLDLLSVHLVRRERGSTIISYHADKSHPTTTAPFLHERIRFAGQSVYWQNIFRRSTDPTFILLIFLWHALYAWDEALENLYSHICTIESQAINTSEMSLTQELHIIRAHHLHYSSLLNDFRKTVTFVRDTKNPALESLSREEQEENSRVMKRECSNLLIEIDRLEQDSKMQDRRLKNVMNLVFNSVNIIDSKRMQKMTEAAVRDSAAMKQIAYLTMVFLPASFVAAVFGMNVEEIAPGTNGTLSHYASTAIPFTLLSIWIIIAFQSRYIFAPNLSLWKRLGWPVLLLLRVFDKDPYKPRQPTSGGGMDDVRLEEEERELEMDLELNMEKIDKRDLPDLTIAEAMDSVERFR